MMRDDPVTFWQTVGEGYVNTQAVAANTFTFGLIPGLNTYADSLVQQNTFYRVVQIGAIVGREVAIGMATGGMGNLVVGAGVRVAGSVAVGLAARVGGQAAAQAVLRAGPAIACRVATAQRLLQPFFAYQQLDMVTSNMQEARNAMQRGDYEGAAALMGRSVGLMPSMLRSMRETVRFTGAAMTLNPTRINNYLQACFAAGTPILGEHSAKPIEEYQVGERVWARDEHDSAGPLELKEIEECFVSVAPIWHVHIGGQVIRTTHEHPFWVQDKGWTRACELQIGDMIVGHDSQNVAVDDILDTGEWEAVYNFRVAEHHTYFVGDDDWGFSAWAHNACVQAIPRSDPRWGPRQINNINIYGRGQNTTGAITDPHAAHMEAVADRLAQTAPAGSYILLNRSWRTALGLQAIGNSGGNPNLRPDIIYVERLGPGNFRIHAYEVVSQGQFEPMLQQRLQNGWSSVVTNNNIQRGELLPIAIGQFP